MREIGGDGRTIFGTWCTALRHDKNRGFSILRLGVDRGIGLKLGRWAAI